jgi:methionine-rich copper-binding protein CopC
VQEDDNEDIISQRPTQVLYQASEEQVESQIEENTSQFDSHLEQTNLDFKENIMRKFVTIKCQDVLQLNAKIEELKIEEEEELNVLNKVYAEND